MVVVKNKALLSGTHIDLLCKGQVSDQFVAMSVVVRTKVAT